jgi:phage terminase large subunit-like protein
MYAIGFDAAKDAEEKADFMRALCKVDLFFLLTEICGRKDMDNDWIHDRCMEVQAAPDEYLDVWARFHYKSSIITFGKTIQDILIDPEETVGIFSFNRPIARGFLRQIKFEFETNEKLKMLYPNVLWTNPQQQAPKWSEEDGIIIKRNGNPKEATVEAYGITDGQPSSKHYSIRVYDDIVNLDSVATPDAIRKTTEAWEMSLNLATLHNPRSRYAGTYYHHNDTYTQIGERETVRIRKYPATDDGARTGKPVLLTRERLEQLYRDMGPYTFATQMLLDPTKEAEEAFKAEWLNFWDAKNLTNLNMYLLCDPASEKKKENDFTVFAIVGLGPDRNYYVVRFVRDRLNLRERGNVLFKLHQEYKPLAVGYEKYGMQSDIEYFKERMEESNYRFGITPLGGIIRKNDRIKRLLPVFAAGRLWLPNSCVYTDYMYRTLDLVKTFTDTEYLPFPYGKHDDMLDCLSRIFDLNTAFPQSDLQKQLTRKEKAILEMLKEQDKTDEYDPLWSGLE